MHPKLLAFVALTLAANSSFGSSGSEPTPSLLGAEAALRSAATAAPATETVNQTEASVQALVVAARKLRTEQASLSPADAATRWQALWFQMTRIKPDYAAGIAPDDLVSVVLAALPRPEAWPFIKPSTKTTAQDQKKSPSLLEAISHSFGNSSAELPEVRQLLSLVLTQNFAEAEALCKDNPASLQTLQSLRRKIEAPSFEAQVEVSANATDEYSSSIEVPDILPRLGADKTKEIALKLLKRGAPISHIVGRETTAIFRETALANVSTLTDPPWELCYSPEGTALYDAFAQRLGNPLKSSAESRKDYRLQLNNQRAASAMIWRAFSWRKTEIRKKQPNSLPKSARFCRMKPASVPNLAISPKPSTSRRRPSTKSSPRSGSSSAPRG